MQEWPSEQTWCVMFCFLLFLDFSRLLRFFHKIENLEKTKKTKWQDPWCGKRLLSKHSVWHVVFLECRKTGCSNKSRGGVPSVPTLSIQSTLYIFGVWLASVPDALLFTQGGQRQKKHLGPGTFSLSHEILIESNGQTNQNCKMHSFDGYQKKGAYK